MDDQVMLEFMSRVYEELKELKSGQLQNRESIEIVAVQTELLTTNLERLESRFDGLETEVRSIKEIVIRIENDHGAKIKVLFDGHLQNKEKIAEHDRILKERGLI